MPLIYNSNTVTTNKFNNTDITLEQYNSQIVFQEALVLTETPTITSVTCQIIGGLNTIRVSVKNNDSQQASIYRAGGFLLGTLSSGATGTFSYDSGISTPYSYTIGIYAQASGKDNSSNASQSGTLFFCSL